MARFWVRSITVAVEGKIELTGKRLKVGDKLGGCQ